jgi:hypothetical protein
MARKLYSYSRGLNNATVKTDDFKDAYQAFENSEFRLRTLLRSMVVSESFFSAPAPPAVANEIAKN